MFPILYQDEHLLAIAKPPGFFVHPPEDKSFPIPDEINCLHLLKQQVKQYLYPVHRLDRPTSGVLLFALTSAAARTLGAAFQNHQIQKTYYAITRGWTPAQGVIDHPLKDESGENSLAAITRFTTAATTELPFPVGRYPSARYSLVRLQPQSGRTHQIRRHLAHISHPIIGDTIYGNGQHNRFCRETLQVESLLLHAQMLKFNHPHTGESLTITTSWGEACLGVLARFHFPIPELLVQR